MSNIDLLNSVCNALGLPKNVRRVTLDMDCRAWPVATVELAVRDQGAVRSVIEKYELRPTKIENPDAMVTNVRQNPEPAGMSGLPEQHGADVPG